MNTKWGIFLAGLFLLFSCSRDEVENKVPNPKDFSFTVLEVSDSKKAITFEDIKKNLKAPTGWYIKGIKIEKDFKDFADITGTGLKDFAIRFKKSGQLELHIHLGKEGTYGFVLKDCKIKATLKADAKDFSFKLLELTGAKEVSIEKIKKNLKAPADWTIKSIKIADPTYADIDSQLKIRIKRGGTFSINITLQKTGWVDFVLKGSIQAAKFKADAKDFSFTTLPVNAKVVTIEQIKKNLNAPAGWTIKSIQIDDTSFADVDSQLKITIKKSGEFSFSITLQKTGYDDYVLKGTIKATFLANAKDFSFPLLKVMGKRGKH